MHRKQNSKSKRVKRGDQTLLDIERISSNDSISMTQEERANDVSWGQESPTRPMFSNSHRSAHLELETNGLISGTRMRNSFIQQGNNKPKSTIVEDINALMDSFEEFDDGVEEINAENRINSQSVVDGQKKPLIPKISQVSAYEENSSSFNFLSESSESSVLTGISSSSDDYNSSTWTGAPSHGNYPEVSCILFKYKEIFTFATFF